MSKHILKCEHCGQYTLQTICPACSSTAVPVKPLKYSPEDPYGDYRRKAKRPMLLQQGLI